MQNLGSFTLEHELGRGGMGVVYRARDPQGARVAVKVLSGATAGPQERARFKREAQVLADLENPHLLRLRHFGLHQGAPFLVTDLIAGPSLAERVSKGGALPVPEALQAVRSLAAGVAHAHSRGLLHRDLKPQNVILGPQGPVVIDFGLGKSLKPEWTVLTQSGAIMGTPGYMPPEQARGERVGTSADVYSLGAILFFLLSGRAPFFGSTHLAVLRQVIQAEPPELEEVGERIPPQVAALVRRCLAKDPAERPASAFALEAELNALLASEGTPPSSRRRPLLAGLALSVLCGVGALGTARAPSRPVDSGLAAQSTVLAQGSRSLRACDAAASSRPGRVWARVTVRKGALSRTSLELVARSNPR